MEFYQVLFCPKHHVRSSMYAHVSKQMRKGWLHDNMLKYEWRDNEIHGYCTRQAAWLHVSMSGKSAIQTTVRFRCVNTSNYICNIIDINCSIVYMLQA